MSNQAVKTDSKAIIKETMSVTRTRQTDLAEAMGIQQSSVSAMVNRQRIGLDIFCRLLQVMDYTVCIGGEKDGVQLILREIVPGTDSVEVINEALAASGIKKVELADRLGISRSGVSKYMNRVQIGLDVFVRIMNAMGYSVLVGKKTDAGFEALWEVGQDE